MSSAVISHNRWEPHTPASWVPSALQRAGSCLGSFRGKQFSSKFIFGSIRVKLFLLSRRDCFALQGLSCKPDFPLHANIKSRNLRYCYKLRNLPTCHISVPQPYLHLQEAVCMQQVPQRPQAGQSVKIQHSVGAVKFRFWAK